MKKNILIIRFSSLGDLVTLEPTFRTFREFFKNDNIIFLTSGIGKGLYQDTKYFDEFVIHQNIFDSIKKLKDCTFDLIYNLQCTRSSHYISLFLEKKKQINSSRNLFQKMFNIKVTSKNLKEMLKLTNFFDSDTIENYFKKYDSDIILTTNIEKNYINKISTKKYIAISTGTSERWLSKKWGISNYINLIKKLKQSDYEIILVGSNLEIEDEKEIFNNIDTPIISYIDKTNLTELKKVLSEVDLFIGNDSGPAHIAAGVGTNTITIFGSTDKKHSPSFLPYKGLHEYVIPHNSIKCHPCYKTKCPTNMECMATITVDQIVNLIVK